MMIKEKPFSTPSTSTTHFLERRRSGNKVLAASAISELVRIRKKTIRESLGCMENNDYRMERIVKMHGVDYINDSGATTLNGTYYSLGTLKTPVIWIAGGDDKGVDYAQLLPMVNEKVIAIIAIGVINQKLISHFNNCVDFIWEAQTMGGAVRRACEFAEKGDTVLLSPACPGLDRFADFKERGNQFNAAVRNL